MDGDGKGRPGWREDYYYGRYPTGPEYPMHPLQRQRSFDYYEGKNKKVLLCFKNKI